MPAKTKLEKMKACICTKYGPPEVLKIVAIEKPTPGNNDVLIRIHATTAHVGDAKIRGMNPGFGPVKDFFVKPIFRLMLGFRKPRSNILGMDLAGEVVETGKDVTKFKEGDHVFASAYEGSKFGAYAEYICMPADGLIAPKPENMTFEEAAPLANGASTASLILKKARIQAGQKVLIYGASGSMGTYSVQLSKYYGAEVTGVCSSGNIDLVESLGADKVIDYTRENFNDTGDKYDVIFDSVAKIPGAERKKSLKKNGVFLDAFRSSNGLAFSAGELLFLKNLCEAEQLTTVIDRRYSLDEIVDAHRYVDSGRKRGNVVIVV